MTKQTVFEFLHKQKHTVISTCGENHQPEAALIGFAETDELELIFGTFNTSKKYKNLKENSKVAFVIGWDEDFITIQYEGVATEAETDQIEKCKEILYKKMPGSLQFASHPAQRYFWVAPQWIRYSDLGGEKEVIEELMF